MNRFGSLKVMLPMMICIAGCASQGDEPGALRSADSACAPQSESAPMLVLDYE